MHTWVMQCDTCKHLSTGITVQVSKLMLIWWFVLKVCMGGGGLRVWAQPKCESWKFHSVTGFSRCWKLPSTFFYIFQLADKDRLDEAMSIIPFERKYKWIFSSSWNFYWCILGRGGEGGCECLSDFRRKPKLGQWWGKQLYTTKLTPVKFVRFKVHGFYQINSDFTGLSVK